MEKLFITLVITLLAVVTLVFCYGALMLACTEQYLDGIVCAFMAGLFITLGCIVLDIKHKQN